MAESSAVQELYVKEDVVGTTPVDSPDWKVYPISGAGGLGTTPQTLQSPRVRSDRGRGAPTTVGFNVDGQYAPVEFKADAFDDILESGLSSTFGATAAGQLENGREIKSFTFQRQFTDLTDKYLKYTGCAVNTMSWVFGDIDQYVTIAANMIALGHDSDSTTSSVGAGSIQPETTNQSMTVLDVSDITLGGTTGYCVESGTIETNNNYRVRRCAGEIDGQELLLGTFYADVNLTLHTTDASWTLLAARDASTPLDFSFAVSDGTTTYTVTLPNVTVSLPDPTAEAENTSIVLQIVASGFQVDGANTIEVVKS